MLQDPTPSSDEPLSWFAGARAAVRMAMYPLESYTPEQIAEIDLARRDRNLRRVQLIAPVLLVLNVVMQWRLRLAVAQSEPEARWRAGLLMLQLSALGFSVWQIALSQFGARSRFVRWYRSVIGESSWLFYGLFGAALSANAQQFHGGFSAFIGSMLLGSTLFQVRGGTALLVSFSSAVIFALGVRWLQPLQSLRTSMYFVALELPLLGLAVSRLGLGAMAREVAMRLKAESASREVDQLNRTLEARVEAQVKELQTRADELYAVNRLLDAEVRDRSRELSAALERIAEGTSTDTLAANTMLAERFLLQRVLGTGGIGVVYAALDTVTDSVVAVKVLNAGLSHNLEDIKRFLREGELLASLNHPAIVRTVHVGITQQGRAFLALEHIDGVNLHTHLRQHSKLTVPEGARVGSIIAGAIGAAHRSGMIHRDIKPSNVMLTPSGVGVKVLDFGLAKAINAGGPDYTLTGEALGTPAFMAPEQFVDFRSVDARADVYSLGLLLFVATTGEKPFTAVTPHEWMMAHALKPLTSIRSIDPDFDSEFADLIERCLAKSPAERPTALDVQAQLESIADRLEAPSAVEISKAATSHHSATTMVAPLTPVRAVATTL